jgi:hypothetical protein
MRKETNPLYKINPKVKRGLEAFINLASKRLFLSRFDDAAKPQKTHPAFIINPSMFIAGLIIN